MRIHAATGLANGITALAMGAWVISKNPRDVRYRTFFIFSVCVAAWSFPYFLWQMSRTAGRALLFSRLLMAGAVFIPVAYFHHACELLKIKRTALVAAGYVSGLFFLAADFTPLFVKSVTPRAGFAWWPDAGPLFLPYLAVFAFFILTTIFLLARKVSASTGVERNQTLYILIGNVMGWSGGATNFPLWYGIPVPPDGNILVSVYFVVVACAIARYRLMDMKLLIRDTAVYAASLAGLSVLAAWATLACLPDRPRLAVIPGSLGILIAPGLYPLVRRWVRPFVNRSLFSGEFDYLDRYKEKMVWVQETAFTYQDLASKLAQAVLDTFPIETASVYFLDIRSGRFLLKARSGAGGGESASLARDDALIRYITGNKPERNLLIVREEIVSGPRRRGLEAEAAATLERIEGEVCAPFLFGGLVKGMLVMGRKKGDRMFHQEDLDAVYAFSRMGEESMRYIMGMEHELQNTALYSHDTSNDFNSMRLALNFLLSPISETSLSEEARASLQGVLDAVTKLYKTYQAHRDRSHLILMEMRGEYARAPLDVTKLLRESCGKFTLVAGQKGLRVQADIVPGPILVEGHEEHLGRVSDNLLSNASHYAKTRVTVTGTCSDGLFRASVEDDGAGIDPAHLEKIWEFGWQAPGAGKGASGMGLAFAKKVIELHGGRIWAESAGPGQGARLTFVLPVMGKETTHELQNAGR